jgi:hypothetical protein
MFGFDRTFARMRGPTIVQTESGPIFIRNELPLPRTTPPPLLRPIVASAPREVPPRKRQSTPARLAVQAEPSTGSGLIDLDAVARELDRAPRLVSPMRLIAPPRPPAEPTRAPRTLLLGSVVLLGTLVTMLGWLALA